MVLLRHALNETDASTSENLKILLNSTDLGFAITTSLGDTT